MQQIKVDQTQPVTAAGGQRIDCWDATDFRGWNQAWFEQNSFLLPDIIFARMFIFVLHPANDEVKWGEC